MRGIRDHHEYIATWVPRKGHRWVAEKLGLKAANVWAYASRRGIVLGDIEGSIRVADVAALAGVHHSAIWARAQREGVMRRLGPPRGKALACVVPSAWADSVVAEYQAQEAGAELLEEAGWLTVNELIRSWKVGRGTIQRGLQGKGVLADLLKDARTTRARAAATGGKIVMNPWDAEEVRKRLEADRHKARQLVSTKSISVECGVKQTYAAGIGASMGGELLFVHGRLMCHVTPETAEIMRQRFRDQLTPGAVKGRPVLNLPAKTCAVCRERFERRVGATHRDSEDTNAYRNRQTCGRVECRVELKRRTIQAKALKAAA